MTISRPIHRTARKSQRRMGLFFYFYPPAMGTGENMDTATDAPVMDAPAVTAEAAETAAEATPEVKPDAPADDLQAKYESAQKRITELNKENEKRRKDAEAAQRAAAEEQGKFKELYEQEKSAREKAEAERQSAEHERMKDRVAASNKLPDALRDRLQGTTLEELEADAKTLAALLPQSDPEKPKAPKLDADKGGTLQGGEMTEARREEIRSRFRI